MEKKIWSTPVAVVESFVPNEAYAQSCFKIACDWGELDPKTDEILGLFGSSGSGYEDGYGKEHVHNHNVITGANVGCGWDTNQYIQVEKVENGQSTVSILEMNTSGGWGSENTFFYTPTTDGSEPEVNPENTTWLGELGLGTVLYWATNVGIGGYTDWMFHKGSMGAVDPNAPLRAS